MKNEKKENCIIIETIKIFYITAVCTATLISAAVHEAFICIPCVILSYWGVNNILLEENKQIIIEKKDD